MASISQLFASVLDLDEMGPPYASLTSKTPLQKMRALRFASAELATYLRQRYAMPMAVEIETTSINIAGAGAATVTGTPEEALSFTVKVITGGTVGVDPITVSLSYDGGTAYEAPVSLANNGIVTSSGLTIIFSGVLTANDTVTMHAGLDYALRGHTVSIAAYKLVYNRGINPNSEPGENLRKLYEDAIAWGEAIATDKARLESAADATPKKDEDGPRWTSQKEPWDFLDGVSIGDET